MAQGLQTRLIHGGEPSPRVEGATVAPIFQSATFLYEGQSSYDSVRYTRCNNNPTQLSVAAKIAAVEGAGKALVTASGMSAIATTLLTFLSAGDHVMVQRSLYGGTYSLVHEDLPKFGIQVTEIDSCRPLTWEPELQQNTKVIYVETISNPLVQLPDLLAIVAFARQHKLISIIDNTFASPINFRPLEHGFDIVIESCTKYMNGHSDIIAGCLSGSARLIDQVLHKHNHFGAALDPHTCFLLQRGLKTLGLRVKQQNMTALALATALESYPQVSKVHYPGLASHPQHSIAASLFGVNNCGGMLSFEMKGGIIAAEKCLQALQLGLVATSLGGVETLVTRPATTSHVGQTPAQRQAMGISDGLIRVSVGIEDTEDLVKDFLQAVDAAGSS